MAIAQEGLIPVLTLGDRMRIAREKRGVTVKEMAETFGVSQPTISNWENDRKQPRRLQYVVAEYARRTGYDLSWFYGTGSTNQRYSDDPGEGHLLAAFGEPDLSDLFRASIVAPPVLQVFE